MAKSTGLKYGPRNFYFRLMPKCVIWKSNLIGFQTRGVDFHEFKSQGQHEKRAVATWDLANRLNVSLETDTRRTSKPVSRALSQGLPGAFCLLAYIAAEDGSS
jgi:hypothetical protein